MAKFDITCASLSTCCVCACVNCPGRLHPFASACTAAADSPAWGICMAADAGECL